MLSIKQFIFNPFGEATYIIYDQKSSDAIVVDPGMVEKAENTRFDKFIEDNNLNITGIINTHLHLDHCFGNNYVKNKYGVPVRAHIADAPLGQNITSQAARFGLPIHSGEPVTIDVPLNQGDTIPLGKDVLHVLHVPGHSPGGIALYSPTGKFVIAGDSLFKGSIGRTDLPGGDHATLIKAVTDKLLTLPDDTLVLSGHGEPTTIGDEKASNPFL
ncbi:MAG: MBL fold metallo-hydrolase [Odoribacter sp.]|nr:MBL fold metallo-hydrolase [Odoribacter sp.]